MSYFIIFLSLQALIIFFCISSGNHRPKDTELEEYEAAEQDAYVAAWYEKHRKKDNIIR